MEDETIQKWQGKGYILTETAGGCWQGECIKQIILLQITSNFTRELTINPVTVEFDNRNKGVGDFDFNCEEFLGMKSINFSKEFIEYMRPIRCEYSYAKVRLERNRLVFKITSNYKEFFEGGKLDEAIGKTGYAVYNFSGPNGSLKLLKGRNSLPEGI